MYILHALYYSRARAHIIYTLVTVYYVIYVFTLNNVLVAVDTDIYAYKTTTQNCVHTTTVHIS